MESEEGEIIDDSPDYEPLQRPVIQFPKVMVQESSDDSSAYDSDTYIPKRQKFTPCAKSKYNVWTDCTDDLLLSLDNFSMDNLDRSRNVESYPYKRPYEHSSHGSHSSLDTSVPESYCRRPKYPRPHRRRSCKAGSREKGRRTLSDLQVSATDSAETIAKDIAKKLCEPKHDLIMNVIAVLGAEKAIELFYETQSIESKGGLLVIDRSRRRTSGGVYFYLVRRDERITYSQKALIFDDMKIHKRSRSLKRKRVKRRTDSSYKGTDGQDKAGRKEHDVLDNPPPSPATETDPVISLPLNRALSPVSSPETEKMDIL